MMPSIRRPVIPILLLHLLGGGGVVHGRLPIADESLEFRFAGAPSKAWRTVRPREARYGAAATNWARAVSPRETREVWWTDRVAVRLPGGAPLSEEDGARLGLRRIRLLSDGLSLWEATDPWQAGRSAERLIRERDAEIALPVMRRRLALHGTYAPRPNDPYFLRQWHLENRDDAANRIGPDTNPRGAWAVTRGEGVTVAICDDGFETDHPDLTETADGAPHFDFTRNRAGAAVYGSHGTCVAGLAGATGGNHLGVVGLAPGVKLASWPIFNGLGDIVSDERLMDMFRYSNDTVAIQNHSWGNADITMSGPSVLELTAIRAAIEQGRGGLGTIFVRSAGNGREDGSNANDDGYPNDPRVIAVAAVRRDGRAASYSNPGACVLVGAPSGDDADSFEPTDNLFTTDRVGSRGYHSGAAGSDLANYAFDEDGFSGTSASAPQASGLAALILSANPRLGYRDVQQVFIHAARYQGPADPDVRTNGAGYRVGHNQGFGIPDAGQAVRLALGWSNRPPLVVSRLPRGATQPRPIPDDGLKVWVKTGEASERSLRCQPALGPHVDVDTGRLPLVFVGRATEPITADLRGRAALIERGTNFFREKIHHAARAGAAFAVIFNHQDGTELLIPAGTDYVPIPAVLIGENDGRALVASLLAGETVEAAIRLEAVRHEFAVTATNALICEHVGLRLRANHERRGDLRVTLRSPAGTISVLQRLNRDTEPGPDNWTYWSVQHFYESSLGTWQAAVADESEGYAGDLLDAELILQGIRIEDTDADGLDDGWERRWFGDLRAGPRDDLDSDGAPNAREQVLGTDPTRSDPEFRIVADTFSPGLLRLAWPASEGFDYRLLRETVPGDARVVEATLPGAYPEIEWLGSPDPKVPQFYRVEAIPR